MMDACQVKLDGREERLRSVSLEFAWGESEDSLAARSAILSAASEDALDIRSAGEAPGLPTAGARQSYF